MIRSLPDLIKDFPQIQYRIAGEGPDKDRLIRLRDLLKLRNHVSFLGKVNSQQLREEFQQAHLFTMLSRKEKHFVEGFGLVFLEAALCQTASLGGHSGGIPDAIDDEKTGWLVDPYSDQAITQKLKSILSDRERLAQVSRQALETTKASKTWDHRMAHFIQSMGL